MLISISGGQSSTPGYSLLRSSNRNPRACIVRGLCRGLFFWNVNIKQVEHDRHLQLLVQRGEHLCRPVMFGKRPEANEAGRDKEANAARCAAYDASNQCTCVYCIGCDGWQAICLMFDGTVRAIMRVTSSANTQ